MVHGEVLEDWQNARTAPLYKSKRDKNEWLNYKGINLLSTSGKVYGKVVIERMVARKDHQIGEQQCCFRRGKVCEPGVCFGEFVRKT